ncbi:MAG: sigma-70 family RNA polymerase sigma factor [Acidobacteriota bacterium]
MAALMIRALKPPGGESPNEIDWAALITACAKDRSDPVLWAEFLRRYAPKIKQFIRGTWRLSITNVSPLVDGTLGGMQESDLFQNTILRIVEQDCSAMKRFSGQSEDEWLAYLAIITRSVVRDALKHQRRLKRPGGREVRMLKFPGVEQPAELGAETGAVSIEREVLGREIKNLCEQTIHSHEAEFSARNMLVFQLYFDKDLSAEQISRCQGVNLSKAGVEKVINRLKERIRSVVSPGASEAVM